MAAKVALRIKEFHSTRLQRETVFKKISIATSIASEEWMPVQTADKF